MEKLKRRLSETQKALLTLEEILQDPYSNQPIKFLPFKFLYLSILNLKRLCQKFFLQFQERQQFF